MQRIKEEKKEILEKLRKELLILKTLNIKPNCSELHRLYNIDRRTIKKYYNRYEKTKQRKTKISEISKIREEIKEELILDPQKIVKQKYKEMRREIPSLKNSYNLGRTIENTIVYPLIKSSDFKQYIICENFNKYVIVTQKKSKKTQVICKQSHLIPGNI